jgi:hypothetical protein
MIHEVHTVKRACVCTACGKRSRLVRGDHDEAVQYATDHGWAKLFELVKKKRATRRVTYTENYYCPKCAKGRSSVLTRDPDSSISTRDVTVEKPGPAGRFERFFIGTQDVRWDGGFIKAARIYRFKHESQLKDFLQTVGGARYPYGGIKAMLSPES